MIYRLECNETYVFQKKKKNDSKTYVENTIRVDDGNMLC